MQCWSPRQYKYQVGWAVESDHPGYLHQISTRILDMWISISHTALHISRTPRAAPQLTSSLFAASSVRLFIRQNIGGVFVKT